MRLPHLLLALATSLTTLTHASDSDTATPYTDPSTSITFQSFPVSSRTDGPSRFGIALPPAGTAQMILQITAPLARSSVGWGGLALGANMRGPLLLVAWPDPATKSITIAPRVAQSYDVDGTVPYTDKPLTLSPIKAGTYYNATHLSATFVCTGCFGDGDSGLGYLSYAYGLEGVKDPGRKDTELSDHTDGGDQGGFEVDVEGARNQKFGEWVAMAGVKEVAASPGSSPTKTDGGKGPEKSHAAGEHHGGGTQADDGVPSEGVVDYNRMTPGAIGALAVAGVVYLAGALGVF